MEFDFFQLLEVGCIIGSLFYVAGKIINRLDTMGKTLDCLVPKVTQNTKDIAVLQEIVK